MCLTFYTSILHQSENRQNPYKKARRTWRWREGEIAVLGLLLDPDGLHHLGIDMMVVNKGKEICKTGIVSVLTTEDSVQLKGNNCKNTGILFDCNGRCGEGHVFQYLSHFKHC